LVSGSPAHMFSEPLILDSGISLHGNIYIPPIFDDEQECCGMVLSLEDLTYLNFLHHAFRRYVPPTVSEIIARDPEKLKLGGEVKNLTVLFSDLVGFTPLAEQLNPDEIITLLSSYFDDMTEEIFKYNGTLKEYSGDEIMAIFGAPVDMDNHAGNACSTALSMQDKLDLLHTKLQACDKPRLKSRIGINTGDMLVGNIGSKYRFSYGVIGDHVNLASRLEGLCKIYGVRILISEHTKQKSKTPFVFREIDHVIVKGREQSTRIYELMGDDSNRKQFQKQIRLYQDALACYKSGDFHSAASLFEFVYSKYPGDTAAQVMAARSAQLCTLSLSDVSWKGIYDFNKHLPF